MLEKVKHPPHPQKPHKHKKKKPQNKKQTQTIIKIIAQNGLQSLYVTADHFSLFLDIDAIGSMLRIEYKGKIRTRVVPSTIVVSVFSKDNPFFRTHINVKNPKRDLCLYSFGVISHDLLCYNLLPPCFCLTIFCVMVFWLCVFPFVFSPWKRRKPFRLTKTGYPPKRLACGRGWWMRRAVLARRSGLFFQVLFANSVQMTHRHPPLPR